MTTPPDALTGWDEDDTARAYADFTRRHPMYTATSRDLARRARLAHASLIVDLCGGTGSTAAAILEHAPHHARVLSIDTAAAMQRAGRRHLTDSRLQWVTAPAEHLDQHAPHHSVDAVVCNSAIWKCDLPAVARAVATVLRPGGRFVFNVGGGFAGVTHPAEHAARTGPSLNRLIHQIAARDYGYTPPPAADNRPKLPEPAIRQALADAGLRTTDTEVTAQHGTTAEKHAWLSIPVFARPAGAGLTHAQRMTILARAYARTSPEAPTVTSWLVVTAERPA